MSSPVHTGDCDYRRRLHWRQSLKMAYKEFTDIGRDLLLWVKWTTNRRFAAMFLHLLRGAFKKFRNSIWHTNVTSKTFTLLFNIITLNSNAHVTFIKQLFDASQIEFLLHAHLVRLFDLIIIFEPCSCSAGCSKGRVHSKLKGQNSRTFQGLSRT